ncbi:hypothetical protein ES704_00909 [subsurface metagenome]|jgi:MoxR-like ATPase
MSDQLFIFTAGSKQAYQHYINTIEEGFNLDFIMQFINDDLYQKLNKYYFDKKIRAWGATPGSGNKNTWSKMSAGDKVLIYRNKTYEYFATVTFKFQNNELAKHLWGTDSKGQTWEYIYLLDGLTKISIPIEPFNNIFDFKPNYIPMGFRDISQNKIAPLIEKYGSLDKFLEYVKEGKIDNDMASKEGDKKMIITNEISEKLKYLHRYILSKGFNYSLKDVANFYLSLKTKPFVILAGISGTGKTQLARKFAEAINAKCELIPVKPDWTDNSDLIGYVDIDNQFKEKAIIRIIKEATSNPQKIYIVLLDEMNLARVEHYFSDFLSIIETREYEGNRIITKNLITDVNYEGEDELKELIIPENFYIVGTVNMDETTHPFSRKVLDRANSIELNQVDLDWINESLGKIEKLEDVNNNFLKAKYLRFQDLPENEKEYSKKIINNLKEIDEILKEADFQIGYRIRDEICFYMLYQKEIEDIISYEEAFDFQIMQKILPRIQGSSFRVKKSIVKLIGYLSGKGDFDEKYSVEDITRSINEVTKNRKSINKLLFMLRRYEDDGFTSFWI